MLEYLHEIGSSIVEPTIVLNEIFARQMLTQADIEGALGRRVAARIPHDPQLFQRAANEGAPVYQTASTSPQGQRFDELAAILVGEDAPTDEAAPRRRGLRGILGRS